VSAQAKKGQKPFSHSIASSYSPLWPLPYLPLAHPGCQNGQNGHDVEEGLEEEDWPVELDSDEEAPPRRPDLGPTGSVEQEDKPTMLEKYAAKLTTVDESKLPKWLFKYLVFRFNLLDRTGENAVIIRLKFPYAATGDNVIDNEEFEYVLSEFGVSPRTARQAFTIFTQVRDAPSSFLLR